jgi:magnesium transporter
VLVTDHRRPNIRSLVRARRPRSSRRDASHDDGLAIADDTPTEARRSKIVDSAIYVDGKRVASPKSLTDTFESLRRRPEDMAWIGLYRPDDHEVGSLASEFQLHPLAVEDAIHAHQRPKIERYDDTLFVVLRPARYLDETEEVEFGEVHVFVGPRFVLTVRHSEAPEFSSVRRRLESQPDLLRRGP